jgi:hypothetical protein
MRSSIWWLRQEYRHPLIMFNTYCFSTSTMVPRTRLSVTLYTYIVLLGIWFESQLFWLIQLFIFSVSPFKYRPRTQHDYHHNTKVKPEAATAVIELLMMGGKMPETCWALNKRQDNKLENCCIWLVIYLNWTLYSKYFLKPNSFRSVPEWQVYSLSQSKFSTQRSSTSLNFLYPLVSSR